MSPATRDLLIMLSLLLNAAGVAAGLMALHGRSST